MIYDDSEAALKGAIVMARPANLQIKPLQRAMAEACAEGYCRANGLSMEKLRTQRFEVIMDQMVFAQPTGVKPDGLCNDIATRPYPTLILRLDDKGELCIEQTEYTQKYLAE